jgi:Protein of unknown function (DUF4013)
MFMTEEEITASLHGILNSDDTGMRGTESIPLYYWHGKPLTGYEMDISNFVRESAGYTRATLAGNGTRWLIIVLLGLPWMLLSTLAESSRILEGTTIHWSRIPWNEAGLLIVTGLLCNFLLSGYIVRLLRGDPLPPAFDHWSRLCLDGMKVNTIPLVWILVPSVLALLEYDISSGRLLPAGPWGATIGSILILILLVIQLVILFIAVQYGIIGAVRFARTGSVREAFVVLEIRKTLSRIGIVNYFVGLGVVTFVWMAFSFVLIQLSFVPFAGPIMALVPGPFLTVFCVRFIGHFTDEDFASAGSAAGSSSPVPAGAILPELLVWLVLLAVLFILCFTPLALVMGSVTGYFR